MTRDKLFFIIALALFSWLVIFAIGAAILNAAPHSAHIAAWREAQHRNLIEGDPAYYYNGDATQEEINHALLTAILNMDLQHIEGITPLDPCPPGSTIAHTQAGFDTYQYVYALSQTDNTRYTRAVGFAQDEGLLMYLFEDPPIGVYGPADIHVICSG